MMRSVVVAVVLMLPVRVAAQFETLGSEFQINSYTTSSQFVPRVAADGSGLFVTAWESFGQDGDDSGVFGQRHDGSGRAVGTEFQVNDYTSGYQRFPVVAAAADGSFVVAWHGYHDAEATGVFGRRYDGAGLVQGIEFQVNTYTIGHQRSAAIVAAPDGFTIAWMSDHDGSGYGVFGQRYDDAGRTIGTEFQVNTHTSGNQRLPAASAGPNGAFVVAWQSYQDGDVSGVFGQRFDSAGRPAGTEFQVNTYTTGYQLGAAVTVDTRGAFVVAWESYRDGGYSGVFAQRFGSNGQRIGSEFQVNGYTSDYQRSPALAAGADGSFVLTWQSRGQDAGGYGVFGRRYDSAGQLAGSEFQINGYTAGYQRLLSIATGGDGTFVVAWQSFNQDGSIDGVFAQRFAGPTSAPTSTPTITETPDPFATPTSTETPTASPSPTATTTTTPTSSPSITMEATPTATATRTVVACTGDCEGDGRVSVDELIAGVNTALGHLPAGDCPAFDRDANETITIDELVAAVHSALNGCTR